MHSHGNNVYADPYHADHARNIVAGSSYTMHYPIGPPLDVMHAYSPMPMPTPMPMNHMSMHPSHRPSAPMMPLQPVTNTASSSFIWPASPPKAAANAQASAPWAQNVPPPPPPAAANPNSKAATTTSATTKPARGGAAAKRKSTAKDEAAAAQSAALLLAPEYTANPAGPASSSDTDFKCSYCDKIYKGKHARSIWRRHLQDKHGIPLASQPRRTRWDNDANRPKSEEERRARTLDSKRRWARKNRGTDGRSAGGDTPGRGGSASFDGRDEGEWEDDQFGDEEGSSAGGRSRSNSISTWQDGKTVLARSGSVPTLGGAGRLQDEKPDPLTLRASQSTSAVPYVSEIDPRHPQHHRSYTHGPPVTIVQPRGSHLPHSPSSYYQAPLAAAVPIGGALSAPLFPQASEAEFYRNDNPTSMMQRLGASIPRPASASSLPPPYAPAQSTSSASLAYYASRASPGRGSRTALRREPKSPVRAESNTEDAAGVLLALKMASPSTSSVLQSPVSATRSRRFDDDSDDDEEEDENAGDLSLEANEPFSAFTAKQASRRTGGSRLVANGRGAAFASPTRDLPSSPEGSDSSNDNWSRNEHASTSTLVDSTTSKQAGKKRSAEDSPPYGSAQALVGLSVSARKIRPIASVAPNGNSHVAGGPLGPNSSYHQYTSLTATPTPAMRVTMESSPAMVYGRDLLEGGSIGRGPRHDHRHDDDDGDLEEDEPSRGGRGRGHAHDGSPSRAMRSHRNGSGPIDDASSSAPRAHHHHPYSHGYPSPASSARHYPQALHHHHPVGLTSDLGHFNLSSSSDPSHPSSSSSSMPPHPSSSSTSFPHSTPGGVSTDYYRLRGSSPPSRSNGGSGYLFSSPAHPGISKQLGLHAQPGPGVLFSGETPGRNAPVDVLESRSKGMRLVEEGGSRAVLKLED
ncbi:BQ2448_3575 [Microbotryum intermedium]|uniref:BQ2448_3575 protein n=1 Tax=Microbotryum intermedium TaxID=269621 RepID=A0A238FFM5_9BASI|nr:BQ2448_3575 [Microbotryum intermedium]